MENVFLCPFIGKFPGATEHLKMWSCFSDGIFQTEIRVTFVKLIVDASYRQMELICTNSKHDSGMKFTSPEFFISFRTQLVNRPVWPIATLETTRKLEPKWVPQLFLGLLLGTRPSAIGQFFSLSPVIVPEVFMKVKSAKFSSCF